jgi:4-methylaminobutanoate oxidase (formaldehyde-forming)
MGPKARNVLEAVTRDDVSNSAFPFATSREITIGGASVRALRITYVGELGWELHVPMDAAAAVYDRLMEAGTRHDIVNAGYRAIESLRLEKAYRAWGSDIGPDYTPHEAGLAWAIKLRQNVPFLGREAVAAQRDRKLTRRLAGFTADGTDIVLLGRETIYRDGRRVGWLSSGGWGYTLATNIGYGYVRDESGISAEDLLRGTYELEVATRRVPARVHLAPLYDPKMSRVKM